MSRDVRGQKNSRWRPVWDRFWDKVKKTDSCWLWTGAVNSSGYGNFKVDGIVCLAHRFVMDAPNDVCVLHHCDTPLCVNPDHLYFGDRKQNAVDRDVRGRNGYQKLTNEQIMEIYTSNELQKDIAAKLGVHRATVGRIKRGESFTWITQEATNRWIDKGHT